MRMSTSDVTFGFVLTRRPLLGVAVLVSLLWPIAASAQQSGNPEEGLYSEEAYTDDEVPGSIDMDLSGMDEEPSEESGGALLLAGKVGGGVPFNDLDLSLIGAVEVGYLFSRSSPSLGVYLDVSYFVPQAEGDSVDARLSEVSSAGDGAYSWHAWQKELSFQPTFLFRLTTLHDVIVPYVGIGPRLYLLETVIEGKAGNERFPISKEKSTKFGFGLPIGAEFTVGPGGIIAELLFQWGPLKHEITGDTHLASGTLWVGYRALL